MKISKISRKWDCIKDEGDVKKYYQNIKGYDMIDFNKLIKSGFNLIIILTERGYKGKTFNGKKFLLDNCNKNELGLWIRNLNKDIENEKDRFLNKIQKIYPSYHNYCFNGTVKSSTLKVVDKKTNEPKINFLAMNSAESYKGGRIDIKYMVWDEFNVNENIVTDLSIKFDSLLHSTEDIDDYSTNDFLFILGNNKTANSRVLVELGVTHILHQATGYYSQGKKIMLLLRPLRSPNEQKIFIEKQQNNWKYHISKVLGHSDHAYNNQTLFDETNSIVRLSDRDDYKDHIIPVVVLHHKKKYLLVSKLDYEEYENNYHIFLLEKQQDVDLYLTAFQTYDIIERAKFRPEAKKFFRRRLTRDNILFDNVSSRELFIESLR